MIHDEIRSLLDSPPQGEEAPSLDAIEDTLTAGYARALALEAERWRLERRIADVAAKLGGKSPDDEHSELTKLGQRLSAADGDLNKLRALLSSLRSRADEVRQPSGQPSN
jgi:ABC-type phosphate transport system auxiliary subunit